MYAFRPHGLPGLGQITALLLLVVVMSPATARADDPPPQFDLATATGGVTGIWGITVDAYSGPSGESPGGGVSFGTYIVVKGQQIPVQIAGRVTCLSVTGNAAVIKADTNFGTITVTLVDNGGAGLDRFAASSSFAPDDCSPGFALSGLPLTGRAVVSDDVDYRAFETRIDTGPAGPTNDSTPTFTFSSSPPGSSFECKVDSESFRACSGPGRSDTAPALSDGLHTFTVRALDSGSNPDPSPATQEFTVDTAPPDTAIDSGPAGITNDATASFTFSSGEPGTRFLCRFDEAGSWNPCESPTVWTDYSELPDGPHTFAVQSIDAASNADPTPATRDFTLDTAVPVITITRQPKRRIKTTRRSRRVKVSFRSEVGSAFECRLDKAAFEPCASPYRVNARSRPGEGREHTISIRATDRAGNSTAPTAVRFRLTRRH
ncbi:MAG: hypothetical protein KDB46_10910 [Solirubrobacterales bacterium]|nr:hypothetical protein [Solirubrobacterales bacterium]